MQIFGVQADTRGQKNQLQKVIESAEKPENRGDDQKV